MTPISKVTTLVAFVSICVCNAQYKLEIPIVLHGTWSVGILIRRHLHPWLTSLNWKYRKIDKWYSYKIVVNCCQINCQTDEISTRSTFTIRIVWKHEKTVTPPPFYMHQLVTCHQVYVCTCCLNPRPTKPFFCNMVYKGGPLKNLKLTGPKYNCLVPWYRLGSPLSIDTKIMKIGQRMTSQWRFQTWPDSKSGFSVKID